jgi:hypothetical protein
MYLKFFLSLFLTREPRHKQADSGKINNINARPRQIPGGANPNCWPPYISKQADGVVPPGKHRSDM